MDYTQAVLFVYYKTIYIAVKCRFWCGVLVRGRWSEETRFLRKSEADVASVVLLYDQESRSYPRVLNTYHYETG